MSRTDDMSINEFYECVKKLYYKVSAMIPDSVDREGAMSAINAGEPECAIENILIDANEQGVLDRAVLDFVEAELTALTGGPVSYVIEELRSDLDRKGVS